MTYFIPGFSSFLHDDDDQDFNMSFPFYQTTTTGGNRNQRRQNRQTKRNELMNRGQDHLTWSWNQSVFQPAACLIDEDQTKYVVSVLFGDRVDRQSVGVEFKNGSLEIHGQEAIQRIMMQTTSDQALQGAGKATLGQGQSGSSLNQPGSGQAPTQGHQTHGAQQGSGSDQVAMKDIQHQTHGAQQGQQQGQGQANEQVKATPSTGEMDQISISTGSTSGTGASQTGSATQQSGHDQSVQGQKQSGASTVVETTKNESTEDVRKDVEISHDQQSKGNTSFASTTSAGSTETSSASTSTSSGQSQDAPLKFIRALSLPEEIQDDKIVAKWEHQVLKITIPKTQTGIRRTITIN